MNVYPTNRKIVNNETEFMKFGLEENIQFLMYVQISRPSKEL